MSSIEVTPQKATTTLSRIKLILISMLLIASLFGGFLFWFYNRHLITTDNAYVNANIVQVSPQVSGKVITLYTQNNQYVKKGTALFELDPEPFQVAVEKERAQLTIAFANWKNAQTSTKRVVALVNKNALSSQELDNAIKNLQVATATLQLSKASLAKAELDLTNCKIYAATNGYISNLSLRVGSVVNAFQPLFVLISDEQYWIDANYKETDLQNIKPGQEAKIIVDMYPSHVFKGVVESISGGSGAAFSLLPPQNATGNWIKITQRVPVKIHVLNSDPNYPLRISTTATVTINTRSKVKN